MVYSARNGSLTTDEIVVTSEGDISTKDISMCGPPRMIERMEHRFRRLGVPPKQIHYEEFNFR